MSCGTIILLNGTSSSGKTSIVKALRDIRDRPAFYVGVDHFNAMRPGWSRGVEAVPEGLAMNSALHHSVAVLAKSGWDVILEHVLCLAVHRDLAAVDLAPFRYLQCVALSRTLPPDYTGPIPGAYHVIAGTLPVPKATDQQLRDAVCKALAALKPVPQFITHTLLERGGGRLPSCVRLLCTDVWSTLYHVLALQQGDAIGVWNLPKEEAIALVPPDTPLGREIRAFYRAIWTYYPDEDSVERALAVIAMGVAFLRTAKSWWEDARVQYLTRVRRRG